MSLQKRRRRQLSLGLERLEGRELLAARLVPIHAPNGTVYVDAGPEPADIKVEYLDSRVIRVSNHGMPQFEFGPSPSGNSPTTLNIRTGSGNDQITVTTIAAWVINIQVDAGHGNDLIYFGLLQEPSHGGHFTDHPTRQHALVGGLGDDTLVGSFGHDSIYGQGGNDALFGLTGNDALDGSDGHDTLDAGPGNDVLAGDFTDRPGTGQDAFAGGLGDDRIFYDWPDHQRPYALIDGGSGTNTLTYLGNARSAAHAVATVDLALADPILTQRPRRRRA